MNAMGHDVPTMIGVDQRGVAEQINQLIPDYMAMGEHGMEEMAEMEMPLPDNTAPMMTGFGPFGAVGMGGMFSVVKVRRGQKAGDFSDPGWFQHPPGTVAYEYQGTPPVAQRVETPRVRSGGERVVDVKRLKNSGGHHQ